MCGIAGAWTERPEEADAAARGMVAAQAHRGPDDSGTMTCSTAGALVLGHRRLSILDLSQAGHQPMVHPVTGDALVINGEIYNFAELRKELASAGSEFRSTGDSEVVLHAFARWGPDCFARFEGMFALGVYAARERALYLARDPLGIKPLYLAETSRGLLFASEARAIAGTGWLDSGVDPRALAGLLAYGAVQAPLCLWRGVQPLEPGTWTVFNSVEGRVRRARSQRYWTFPAVQPVAPNWDDARRMIRERLLSAVRSHLVSDVPVGVFLSSGLDSSALAALAAQVRGGDVDTFTVGSVEAGKLDERAVAERTSRALGARHHEVRLSAEDVTRRAQEWFVSQDQPSVDGLNTFIISRAVRERGVVVALSGLGGDELFGGYSTFTEVPRLLRWARTLSPIPRSMRRRAASWLLWRRPVVQRRKATEAAGMRASLTGLYFRRRRLVSDEELEGLGLGAARLGLDEDYLPAEADRELGLTPGDALASLRVLESRFYMGNMLLRDSDVCSMAHGLELRVPLLDTPLLNAAYALPGSMSMPREGRSKPLFVDAVRDLLPAELLSLPKQGFVLPYATWMSGPLRDLFEARWRRVDESGLVDPRVAREIRAEFFREPTSVVWSRAWMLGALGQWLERNAAPVPTAREQVS